MKKNKNGFTLIEILLVLALLGLVFSILGKRVFSGFSRGKVQATKIQIKQLEGDMDRYRLDCIFYPTTEQGLKALVEKPTAGKDAKTTTLLATTAAKKLLRQMLGEMIFNTPLMA